MTIDNGGGSGVAVTPIERIGRRAIVDAVDLGDGRWSVDTLPDTDVRLSVTESVSNGLATPAPFSVGRSQTVRLRVTASGFTPHTFIFRDDGDLTDDDYVTDIDTSTNQTRALDPGDYLLVMGVWWSNAVSDIRRNFTGTYTVTVDTEGAPWLLTNSTFDFGVQGLGVDLNADDEISEIYTVDANDGYRLFIETADDLSGVVGNNLVGVHRLEGLTVDGNAQADFGGDRVEVTDFSEFAVTSGAGLLNVDLPDAHLNDLAGSHQGGRIRVPAAVQFADLTISTDGLDFGDMTVATALTLNGTGTATIDQLDTGSLRRRRRVADVDGRRRYRRRRSEQRRRRRCRNARRSGGRDDGHGCGAVGSGCHDRRQSAGERVDGDADGR